MFMRFTTFMNLKDMLYVLSKSIMLIFHEHESKKSML
jgi:hypothetical protein